MAMSWNCIKNHRATTQSETITNSGIDQCFYLRELVVVFVNVYLIDSACDFGIVRCFAQKVHAQFDQPFVKRWNSVYTIIRGEYQTEISIQILIQHFDLRVVLNDAMGGGQDFGGANQRSTADQLVSP